MITSRANPHIKRLKNLSKKRGRDLEGLFLIEGEPEIRAFGEVEEIYYSERNEWIAKMHQKGVSCTEVAPEILNTVTYREKAPIAIAKKLQFSQKDLDACQYLLAIESMEKPGNIGAILRTAVASGVEGVLICDASTDIYHPNVIRNSKGVFGKLPFIESTSEEALTYLKNRQMILFVTTPRAKQTYYDVNYKQPSCIAVGCESRGLSEIWLSQEAEEILIPMIGPVDSLNASVSAALVLYEALRQRRFHTTINGIA